MSKRIARVDVVPWSMERTKEAVGDVMMPNTRFVGCGLGRAEARQSDGEGAIGSEASVSPFPTVIV